MNNQLTSGNTVTLTAPYDVASGGGFLVGGIFAVAVAAALLGEQVVGQRSGSYRLPALTTDVATAGAPAYWDDTNKRITVVATGNTLVGHYLEAKADGDTTAVVLLDGPTAAASPDVVTSTVITVSSAELLALNAAPKALIAAPGAGKAIVPVDASLFLDFNSVAYDGVASNEDLAFRYTNGSGAQLGTVETDGFLTASADAHREHIFSGTITPAANAAVVLHLLSGEIATGNSPLKVRVRYRVVDLLT